jgi:hypothetical protein
MEARNECIQQIKEEARQALLAKDDPVEYRATLKNLIIQGMIRLLEENVELMVRE